MQEGSTATFTITISPTSNTDTVVPYTVSGSATLGQDFTLSGTPGQVVIPAGQSSVAITLTALNDGTVEEQESVTLSVPGKGRNIFATIFIQKQKGPHR
jgi:hypothetical protein